jgi:hypothetical protein
MIIQEVRYVIGNAFSIKTRRFHEHVMGHSRKSIPILSVLGHCDWLKRFNVERITPFEIVKDLLFVVLDSLVMLLVCVLSARTSEEES